jgi:hypothetical protein
VGTPYAAWYSDRPVVSLCRHCYTNVTCASSPGQAVTFTIQVSARGIVMFSAANTAMQGAATASATDPAAPSGQVTLLDGSAMLDTVILDTSGAAAFTITALSLGTHTITAQYGGDANYNAGTSPAIDQEVSKAGKATTTITVASSANPVPVGRPATFTALVNSATGGTPTGTVTFRDGGTILGTVTLQGGSASLGINGLSAGRHTIRATYSGDGTSRGGAASLVLTVLKYATSVGLTSSLNPALVGQTITYCAVASAPAGGVATGMVSFNSAGKLLGTAALGANGQATFSINSLSAGPHTRSPTKSCPWEWVRDRRKSRPAVQPRSVGIFGPVCYARPARVSCCRLTGTCHSCVSHRPVGRAFLWMDGMPPDSAKSEAGSERMW